MRLSLTVVMGAALIAAPVIAAPTTTALGAQQQPAPAQHYVDLNSASRQELMTLPGIDSEAASRIVANRPYRTKTDLVTKDVLPAGPFLSLRHLVVALPATVSKGRR